MGLYAIKMPDIGEGIAEVELVAWRVAPGDAVAEDQILADVMTDKATVEIPSPVAGKVVSLAARTGELTAVGAELIRLEVAGAGNVAGPSGAAHAPAAAGPAAAKRSEGATRSEPTTRSEAAPAPGACLPAPAAARPAGQKPLASPAVRQRAWDLGLELHELAGSGPDGRIVQEDIDALVARQRLAGEGSVGGAVAVSAGGSLGGSVGGSGAARHRTRSEELEVPVIGLRRKIAQKMQESKRRIPHFSYVEEVDVTELEALRLQLNQRFAGRRAKLTLLPFIVRAMVLALAEFPQMNARFDDDGGVVTRFGAVHAGIATQTESGLMVPVLRHAEAHDVWALGEEITRLSGATRLGKATREELSGSTITVSSLGALGGIASTPVINHPEVAIIGVNRMVERPVIDRGMVVARKLMNLSSSFDHRVVDGMDAAQFIQAVRNALENPALLFVDAS